MKISDRNINGSVVRDNEVYTVIDNVYLKNLTLSKTVLNPSKRTSGHLHDDIDEIYFFISGVGRIKLDDEETLVSAGDVVLIPSGTFHQVFNDSDEYQLEFNCVFESYKR